jgi:hypothetical protein
MEMSPETIALVFTLLKYKKKEKAKIVVGRLYVACKS